MVFCKDESITIVLTTEYNNNHIRAFASKFEEYVYNNLQCEFKFVSVFFLSNFEFEF